MIRINFGDNLGDNRTIICGFRQFYKSREWKGYARFFLPLKTIIDYRISILEHYSCEYGSIKYYIYCGISGMLSCGLTHTAVVPLVR